MPSKNKNKNKKNRKIIIIQRMKRIQILKQIINLKRKKTRRKSTRKENGMNI